MVQLLEMARISALFERAGIRWLALKGLALAVQSAGSFRARGGGDIDVFVAPQSVEDVLRLLGEHGWAVRGTSPSDPHSWAWRYVLRTYHEMTFDGPHSTIDVHWRLDPTQSGLADFETAWQRRASVEVGDLEVATLDVRDAFSQSCNHAAKDDWRSLRSLVDVHRMARQPPVWEQPLRRLDTAALAVTDACIGLPVELPAAVVDRVATASQRPVRRAFAAQFVTAEHRVRTGAHTLRGVRYRIASSSCAEDVRIALAAAVLPADAVADSTAASAWRAIPRLLVLRLGRWLHRMISHPSRHTSVPVTAPTARSS